MDKTYVLIYRFLNPNQSKISEIIPYVMIKVFSSDNFWNITFYNVQYSQTSNFYYPRHLGVVNFGLKNRG